MSIVVLYWWHECPITDGAPAHRPESLFEHFSFLVLANTLNFKQHFGRSWSLAFLLLWSWSFNGQWLWSSSVRTIQYGEGGEVPTKRTSYFGLNRSSNSSTAQGPLVWNAYWMKICILFFFLCNLFLFSFFFFQSSFWLKQNNFKNKHCQKHNGPRVFGLQLEISPATKHANSVERNIKAKDCTMAKL